MFYLQCTPDPSVPSKRDISIQKQIYLVLVFLLQRPPPPYEVLHGLHQAFSLSTEPMARVLRFIAALTSK